MACLNLSIIMSTIEAMRSIIVLVEQLSAGRGGAIGGATSWTASAFLTQSLSFRRPRGCEDVDVKGN